MKGVIGRNVCRDSTKKHSFITDKSETIKLVAVRRSRDELDVAWQGRSRRVRHDGMVSPAYVVLEFAQMESLSFLRTICLDWPYST